MSLANSSVNVQEQFHWWPLLAPTPCAPAFATVCAPFVVGCLFGTTPLLCLQLITSTTTTTTSTTTSITTIASQWVVSLAALFYISVVSNININIKNSNNNNNIIIISHWHHPPSFSVCCWSHWLLQMKMSHKQMGLADSGQVVIICIDWYIIWSR